MESCEVVMVFNSWVELILLWTIWATAFVLGVSSYWNIKQPKPIQNPKPPTRQNKTKVIAYKCHNKFENGGIMLHDCGIL